jgi:hypothetical protein
MNLMSALTRHDSIFILQGENSCACIMLKLGRLKLEAAIP